MKLLAVALLLTSLALVSTSLAQTAKHNHAAVTPVDMIDGSKTPSLIPDLAAWRLWMLSVTQKDPDHPELDQQRQDAFLKAAGYEDEDLPVVRQVVHDFRSAYDSMIQEHNLAEAAKQSPSLASLITRRDLLVEEAQASMLSVNSERAARVKTFINGEKKRMQVPKAEVQ